LCCCPRLGLCYKLYGKNEALQIVRKPHFVRALVEATPCHFLSRMNLCLMDYSCVINGPACKLPLVHLYHIISYHLTTPTTPICTHDAICVFPIFIHHTHACKRFIEPLHRTRPVSSRSHFSLSHSLVFSLLSCSFSSSQKRFFLFWEKFFPFFGFCV